MNEIKQMLSSEIMTLSELTLVHVCLLSSSARRQLTGELVHLLSDFRISAQVSWTAHSGRQCFTRPEPQDGMFRMELIVVLQTEVKVDEGLRYLTIKCSFGPAPPLQYCSLGRRFLQSVLSGITT